MYIVSDTETVTCTLHMVLFHCMILGGVFDSYLSVTEEADRVLDTESSLLDMPHGLPTFADKENGRQKAKDASITGKGHDIFL